MYQDPRENTLSGGLLQANVPALSPKISNTLHMANGEVTGALTVASQPTTVVSGYLNTRDGLVTTTVKQAFNFVSTQTFDITNTLEKQDLVLTNGVNTVTTTSQGRARPSTQRSEWRFPLKLNYLLIGNPDGSYTQTTTSRQTYIDRLLRKQYQRKHDDPRLERVEKNSVRSTDVLNFDSNFSLTGHHGMLSAQRYQYNDFRPFGPFKTQRCYDRTIRNKANKVAAVDDHKRCYPTYYRRRPPYHGHEN